MKVSVILPVYNGEKYLISCLESLREQTLQECEIICVDDGSMDKSGEILDAYQKKYPGQFRVFHRENMGVYKAREFGLGQATGEYVAFCDCDDTVDKHIYESLYDCAVRAKAEMSVCAYERIDAMSGRVLCEEMSQFGNKTIVVEKQKEQLAVVNTALWNKLIKKEVVERHIHFETAPRVAEDMMLLLSIYPYTKRVAFCPQSLYRYYVRCDSAMSHVEVGEIAHLKKCMLQVKRHVRQKKGTGWDNVISLFAFIHFGVAFLLKMAKGEGGKAGLLQKDMECWLNQHFKGWDKNPYLRCTYVMKGHNYLFKPMILLYIYHMGLFPVFLKIYLYLIDSLRINIKW